uniref:Fucolectin tachylectin-4 pentraxin-1 domain-containing protein n=1 Tax=Sarcophilus harrisii TaxID=9305 RepID=A0A7N4PAX1_SARHA
MNPWWMVDLGSTEIVQSVAITPRNDCCTEELQGALILVGDSRDEGGMPNNRCAIIGSLAHGKTEFFRCGMMRGRYVSVVNPKREETFLSFCEVRVFGKASESISPSLPTPSLESQLSTPNASNASDLIGPLLSKQRPTSQSSVFVLSPFLQKPMNGSIQSNYCVQTLQENDPWWMIDLGSTRTLGYVSITNRKDCCPELIKGTLILVGDSSDQGGKWNARCAIIPSVGLGIKQVFNCSEMNGRYVTITKPGKEKVLSFCDLKVFGKTLNSKNNVFYDSSSTLPPTSDDDQQITNHGSNSSYYNFDLTENNFAPVLSKGKPAFQSSISNPFGSPERAVDGSLLSDFDEGNCIQTNKEINPWWMVDLGSTETVKSVAITPRKDCCTEELYGAFILVGELPENGGIFNSKCAVIGSLSRGKTEFFRCGTMRGRYVSVISPKREIFLSFCEVRVFGKTSDFISHDDLPITPPVTSLPKANDDTVLTGPLLSEQRPTSQSSASLPSQSPQKPMDGSIQSGYCVQTLQENDPWWMIDLGSTQTLGFVSITNRKDCCPEQIKGTLILVGDTPHHGGKWNARCAIIPSLGLGIKQIFSCGEMNGRYVTITKPGREKVLSFCDVKVFGKAQNSDKNGLSSTLSSTSADNQQINNHFNSYYNFDLTQNNFAPVLSEGKPAFQSSIFSFSGSPERAVDGSLFSDFEKGTCIQTDRKINPWWMVDLGSTEIVQSVALTPRNDCCTEELRGALILVGDSHDEGGMPNNRCAIIGSLAHGKTEFFRCGMMRGRYVSVVNPKREETFLSFCEVRVFGKASESISPSLPTPSPESQLSTPNASNASDLIGPLLSKQRPTSQSSVFIPSPFLQKPMDGSIQSNYCVQTLQENDPWWMIDLGSTQTLGFVSITNRKDCCPELIKGTLILVGDSPDQGGKWNDRCAIIPSLGLGIKELFNCGEMNGRYVTITKPGREKVLSFCDLKVFGKSSNSKNNVFHDSSSTLSPTSGDDQHITDHGSYYNFDLTENNFAPVLSKGKPTFQSSISNPFGSPERAVDGSLLSDFDEGNCIQTNKDINPWWMVDLGSTETVKSVAITPRKDCCTEELYGAFILVGELPENGGIF